MYERYKKLLDEKNLKNADVSRGANVSNMTLSDWKNGKTIPKTDTLRKIAEFLEVSVDYFFGSENYQIDNENHTWDYIVCDKDKDMQLIIELMKNKEAKNELMQFARFLAYQNGISK